MNNGFGTPASIFLLFAAALTLSPNAQPIPASVDTLKLDAHDSTLTDRNTNIQTIDSAIGTPLDITFSGHLQSMNATGDSVDISLYVNASDVIQSSASFRVDFRVNSYWMGSENSTVPEDGIWRTVNYRFRRVGLITPNDVIQIRVYSDAGGFIYKDKRYISTFPGQLPQNGASVAIFKVSPYPPQLLSPSDGVTQYQTSTLSWNRLVYADRYRIQVSHDSSFASIVIDTTIYYGNDVLVHNDMAGGSYFWRVSASNISAYSEWSPAWNYHTILLTLNYPIQGRPTDPHHAIMSWQAWTSGNSKYDHIQISRDSIFSNLVFEDSLVGFNPYILPIRLQYGATYYWRVRERVLSIHGQWSSVEKFTTIPEAPLPPTLVSPDNGALNVPLNPILVWHASPNASQYRLQVSFDPFFGSLLKDTSIITDSLSALNGLTANRIHYWRVNSWNLGGTSAWSETRVFTTIVPLPGSPQLIRPKVGDTLTRDSVTLVWRASSPNVTGYRLELSPDSTFATRVTSYTPADTTQFVRNLARGTVYHWRVRAANFAGLGPYGPVSSFFVLPAPGAPALAFPLSGDTLHRDSALLVWHGGSQNTVGYQLEISTDSIFAAADTAFIPEDTAHVISGLRSGSWYYWRVEQFDSAGPGPFSPIARFFCLLAPGQVEIIFPAAGDTVKRDTATFAWHAGPASIFGYHFEISKDSSFSEPDTAFVAMDTVIMRKGLQDGSSYYWRVRQSNASGAGPYGPIRRFLFLPLPGPLVLISPSAGDTLRQDSVQLAWRAGAAMSLGYHLEFSRDSLFSHPDTFYLAQDTTKVIHGLESGAAYYWRVKDVKASGAGPFGTIGKFFIRLYPDPVGEVNTLQRTFAIGQDGVLRFSLSRQSRVFAALYRPNGMTSELMNRVYPPGSYAIPLDADPKGIRIIRFQAAAFRRTLVLGPD